MSGKGYVLPEIINPPDDVCIRIHIPNETFHRIAFWGALRQLTYWYNWQRDEAKRGTLVADVWRDIIDRASDEANGDDCGCDDRPYGGCVTYPATAPFIRYLPADVGETPNGYVRPAWELAGGSLVDDLFGIEEGDIYTDLSRLPLINIEAITNGILYPTIEIDLDGYGEVELHFKNLALGGRALITVDNPPDLGDIIASLGFGDILDLFTGVFGADFGFGDGTLIDLNRDIISIPVESEVETIKELEIEEDGEHTIYVLMLPTLNDSADFLTFGGALHKIVLCGENIRPRGAPPINEPDSEVIIITMAELETSVENIMRKMLGGLVNDCDPCGDGASGSGGFVDEDEDGFDDVTGAPIPTATERTLGSAYGVPQGMQRLLNDLEAAYDTGLVAAVAASQLEALYDVNQAELNTFVLEYYDDRTNSILSPIDLDDDPFAGYVFCSPSIRQAASRYRIEQTSGQIEATLSNLIPAITDAQFQLWYEAGADQPRDNFTIAPCYRQGVRTLIADNTNIDRVIDNTKIFVEGYEQFPTQRLIKVTAFGLFSDDSDPDNFVDPLYRTDNSWSSQTAWMDITGRLVLDTQNLQPTTAFADYPAYNSSHQYSWFQLVAANTDVGNINFGEPRFDDWITTPNGQFTFIVEDLGEFV